MSDLIVSLKLAWCVVVRNWVVYRKDFLANVSPTLADPALMMTALGMGLSPYIGNIHGLSYSQYLVRAWRLPRSFLPRFSMQLRLLRPHEVRIRLQSDADYADRTRDVVFGEFIWVSIRAALMAGRVELC